MSKSVKNLNLFRKVLDVYLIELANESYVCERSKLNSLDVINRIKKDSLLHFCKVSRKTNIKDAIEQSIKYGSCGQNISKQVAVCFSSTCSHDKECCNYDCLTIDCLKAKRTFEYYLGMAMNIAFPPSKIKNLFSIL